MKKLTPFGKPQKKYIGKIFEIIHQDYKSGEKIITFEIAKRSPGVRLIILNNKNEILLSKEYRTEIEKFDYRLPGGKVFDSNEEMVNYDLSKIESYAEKAAIKECLEETGLNVKKIKLYLKSKAGSSVEWDLYYFVVDDFDISKDGQELEVGEIITIDWYSIKKLLDFCENGNIKEDRSLGIIFRFLLEKKLLQLKN